MNEPQMVMRWVRWVFRESPGCGEWCSRLIESDMVPVLNVESFKRLRAH